MKKNSAFTLIELLLGLSIFALIIVSIYSVFWGGIRLSRRAQEQGDVYREARWALELIDQELQNAVLYNFTKSYKDKTAFSGEKNQLTFILAKEDGLKVVTYHLVSPEQGQIHKVSIGETITHNVDTVIKSSTTEAKINYLVREELKFVDYLNNVADSKDTQILATNVSQDSLKFSFASQEGKENKKIVWKSTWNTVDLPFTVRVAINLQSLEKPYRRLALTKDIFLPQASSNKETTDAAQ